MDITELILDIIGTANNSQLSRFLGITKQEVETMYEEETLTDLQEAIFNKYNQVSEEEFQYFLSEISNKIEF